MADLPLTPPLTDSGYALITTSARRLMPEGSSNILIPNVVIEEIATDTLRVTDHPCEMGAAVSDHAFKLPAEIVMRCGWSDSTGREEGYTALQYWFLQQLQKDRKPFTVVTNMRIYKSMLISFLNKTADEHIGKNAMLISVGMREVIIASTTVIPTLASMGLVPLAPSSSSPLFTTIDPNASGTLPAAPTTLPSELGGGNAP